jgi:FAD dependent monooxygenase
MTADLGIGANIAIEDATVLCNILNRELKADRNRHPTKDEINSIFAEYQKERYDRAKAFTELSGKATRMNSYDTLFGRIFATYVAPMLYEVQIKKLATAWAKAPKLDYVPVKTIDETAPGWLMAKEDDKKSSTPWLLYAGVGAVVTGLAVQRFGLPKL